MFQAHAALFLYATSPVHMGAGQAFGLIDNPIARERHSEHPVFPGSGLKGALRHRFHALPGWSEGEKSKTLLDRLFGPESQSGDLHAGAVSLGDAQLVAFPVRSVKQGYVYATSAHALARAARLLAQLGVAGMPTLPDAVAPGSAHVANEKLLSGTDKLHLEAFEYQADTSAPLAAVARWLADNALPTGSAHDFFREKFATDLVLLADEDLTWLARNATVVEPHVRIDNDTGTASNGGLFYTENLPPESLMLGSLMTSRERSGREDGLEAEAVLAQVSGAIDGQLLQVGGDATTGRGLVSARVLRGNAT